MSYASMAQSKKSIPNKSSNDIIIQVDTYMRGAHYYKKSDPQTIYRFGFFGTSDELFSILEKSQSAKEDLNKYKNNVIASRLLIITGSLISIVALSWVSDNYWRVTNAQFGYFLTAGFGSLLAGLALQIEAKNLLKSALHKYNHDVRGLTKFKASNQDVGLNIRLVYQY